MEYENYIVIKIKDIDYVKVLFQEDLPENWKFHQMQNYSIAVLSTLFEDFEVNLHGRHKSKKEE